jgi:hypothetical protein
MVFVIENFLPETQCYVFGVKLIVAQIAATDAIIAIGHGAKHAKSQGTWTKIVACFMHSDYEGRLLDPRSFYCNTSNMKKLSNFEGRSLPKDKKFQLLGDLLLP